MAMPVDLVHEFGRAIRIVPLDDEGPVGEWLARRGLTAERRHAVGELGILKAILSRSTMTFEPNDDGERVLVAPVWGGRAAEPECPALHLSELVDLVGWRPNDPATLYQRLGLASVMGREGLRLSLATASPLRLFRTVEAFIRYGGESQGEFPAAVLLNFNMAWLHLADLPAVIADDIEHGTVLDEILKRQRPAPPPIRVPVSVLEAAE
ncbi:hypothetical protein GAY33_17365 [Azospirillum brasilense]|uniref:hypothetical protein n=1 Tax=Azospirillum argentinense TaxID=2970906 RepID=UPI00190E9BC2|nr:hypothetical protein [Azospirillum argentinense]MBK3800974.1 hypothetical protein [Azospirillum argentinense]